MHSIDFVMMNPPFYTSDDEMLSSAEKKSRPPHSACTGAPVEMVCDGGEVVYVGRMIQESLGLRGRIQWYTSMLGKVSSLVTLVDRLRLNGIDNFAVTELVQGNKTRRWALGWSFGPMRPTESVARGMKASIWKKLLPLPVRMDLLVFPSGVEIRPLIQRIIEITGSLEMISWCWDSERLKGIGRVRENVWSRAWRRRKARETKEGVPADASRPGATEPEQCQLGFAISVEVGISQTMTSLHWLEGHDHGLFESLGGFLQGKLQGL
jgi:23S rRNA (adenine1618-N6)-methyltransferase